MDESNEPSSRPVGRYQMRIIVRLLIAAFIISGSALYSSKWDEKHTKKEYSSDELLKDVQHAGLENTLDLPMFLRKRQSMTNLIVVDAREKTEYDTGHIPGAINIPVDEAALASNDLSKRAAPSTEIVVYCSRLSCTAARLLRARLVGKNFTSVLVYSGGFEEWAACGLEVAK